MNLSLIAFLVFAAVIVVVLIMGMRITDNYKGRAYNVIAMVSSVAGLIFVTATSVVGAEHIALSSWLLLSFFLVTGVLSLLNFRQHSFSNAG